MLKFILEAQLLYNKGYVSHSQTDSLNHTLTQNVMFIFLEVFGLPQGAWVWSLVVVRMTIELKHCNTLHHFFRFQAIDYAGPAGSNDGVIMSKKPGPISPALNFIKVRYLDLRPKQYHPILFFKKNTKNEDDCVIGIESIFKKLRN